MNFILAISDACLFFSDTRISTSTNAIYSESKNPKDHGQDREVLFEKKRTAKHVANDRMNVSFSNIISCKKNQILFRCSVENVQILETQNQSKSFQVLYLSILLILDCPSSTSKTPSGSKSRSKSETKSRSSVPLRSRTRSKPFGSGMHSCSEKTP